MSPTCVQNETTDGGAQVIVFMSHAPLQQSPLLAQALPAVWQPVPSCAHMPLWQALGPLQHGAPPAVHEVPSEMHWVGAHMPLLQFKLQQSLALAQAAPVGLHT